MSVRIDEDFWENYKEHEELLRRCFTSLYCRKYSVPEGPESAFNFLVAEFWRKGIFERFEADRKGTKRQAVDKYKTTKKKFEQYIYTWTESTLGGLYHAERKYKRRNLRLSNDKLDTFNDKAYGYFKENNGISSWSSAQGKELIEEERLIASKKNYPCIVDTEDYRAENPMDALEEYEEKKLDNFLDSILKNDRERIIVQGKRDGLTNTTIGEMVDISSAQVANILKSIRSRCGSMLAA